MKLVLKCWSSHDITYGCNYALVVLTPELAKLMLERLEFVRTRKARDDDFYEAYWWDRHAFYFSPWGDMSGGDPARQPNEKQTELLEGFLDGLLDKADFAEIPADFDIPESTEARTECDQMIVRIDGVTFTCIPKHTDIYITTACVSLEILERAASGGK